jgi:glycine hydroxymethyltransferase
MAHIAGLVAAGVHPNPVPQLRFRDDDHAQDAARTARRLVLCREQYAKDLDRTRLPGVQGGPLMHIIAAKAVCFKEARSRRSPTISGRSSPTPRARRGAVARGFRLVSGGTDNHLMLVDVFSKGITGKVAEAALGKAGITVNKNAIPFDQNPPMVASGIRVGTPAVTTRGMREAEMDTIGELITRALRRRPTTARLAMVRAEVETLCRKFPLYPES